MHNREMIKQFLDSHTGQYIFRESKIHQQGKQIDVTVNFPCALEHQRYQQELLEILKDSAIESVNIQQNITSHQVQSGLKPLPSVKNIIAIASGKGGVGKSTVSANLAIALKQQGANVGLLDADIYGPSISKMLGGAMPPNSTDGKTILPNIRYGLQTLSMGDLVEEDTPMIWRGPMVTQTLTQLLKDTQWQALDYLIIDLPPGTGDIQLTLSQQIPVSGAIIVTTPQDLALLDARKAYSMFEKVKIPTLGLIENMSTFICPHCHHETEIFGHGGGKSLAQEKKLPFLGEIPLDINLRSQSDQGIPLTEQQPDHALSKIYQHIALVLGYELSNYKKDFQHLFPKITIEH